MSAAKRKGQVLLCNKVGYSFDQKGTSKLVTTMEHICGSLLSTTIDSCYTLYSSKPIKTRFEIPIFTSSKHHTMWYHRSMDTHLLLLPIPIPSQQKAKQELLTVYMCTCKCLALRTVLYMF
jgi:hypothetical protein